jgi:hypothetical protein
MAGEREMSDWIIQVIKFKEKSIEVQVPGQLLFVDHYVRDPDTGKERWVFHLEVPRRGQVMPWKDFDRFARRLLGRKEPSKPRTCAIRDIAVADGLLSLWTATGLISWRAT